MKTKQIEIKQLLQEQKQLSVKDSIIDQLGLLCIVNVIDANNQPYTILIICLSENDDQEEDIISQAKLQEAQLKAKQLKHCNYKNIPKYSSEFQIENYYFIQMEKCEQTLQQCFANQSRNQINKILFTRISLEVFEVADYLHHQGYTLRDLTLNNILLTSDLSVRIVNFGVSQEVNRSIIQSTLLDSIKNNQLFYYSPELLELDIKEHRKIQLNHEDDLWAIGVCLYSLTGVSISHILDFVQGLDQYRPNYLLGFDLNTVLISILIRKQTNLKRPSIPFIIEYLKNLMIDFEKSNQKQFDDSDQIGEEEKSIEYSQEIDDIKLKQLQSSLDSLSSGIQHLNSKQYNEALINYQKCLNFNPNNTIVLTHLGRTKIKMEQFDAGIQNCIEAIKINTKNDYAYQNLGNACSDQGKRQEAISYYQQTIQINPKNDQAYFNIGNQYQNLREFDKAITYYKIAIETNPLDSDFYVNFGNSQFKKQKAMGALQCYKQATRVNLKKENANYNSGLVSCTLKLYEKSIKNQKLVMKCGNYNQLNLQKLSQYKKQI